MAATRPKIGKTWIECAKPFLDVVGGTKGGILFRSTIIQPFFRYGIE